MAKEKKRKSKRLAAKRASEATDPFVPSQDITSNENAPDSRTTENDKPNDETVASMTSDLSACQVSNNTDKTSSVASSLHDHACQETTSSVKKDIVKEIPPETEPVPHFVILEQNDYLFDRKKSRSRNDIRRMVCDCFLTKEERHRKIMGCTEDCLNRMLMIECGSRCPLGEQCANKRFQKRQYAKVQPFRAGLKGWGLRAMQRIPAGSFILEYVGEVVDPDMFRSRVKKYDREGQVHHYFMALKSDEVIDATVKGNIGRFTNHSCEPNCETQKWTVNGELRVGFFAITTIEAGEEVTLDYQFQRYGKEAQKCYCGTASCRGFIGATEESTIDLDGSKMSSKQRSRIASIDAKLRAREFEDVALEAEIDKLVSTGFLKNKLQTMSLARIMVRTEDTACRMKLLNVINNTQVPVFLRLFLDYHGLQLLWSWMVDAEDPLLKAAILQVLSILPIPNRTVLVDSKVLDMVQKWTIPEETKPVVLPVNESQSEQPQTMTEVVEASRISQDSCSNSQSSSIDALAADELMPDDSDFNTLKEENTEPSCDSSTLAKQDENKVEEVKPNAEVKAEEIQQPSSQEGKTCTYEAETKCEESSQDTQPEEKDMKSEEEDILKELPNISQLAERLLFMWKDLKEGFKIPRVIRQNRLNDEKEASQTIESESSRPRQDNRQTNRDNDPTSSILLRRKKPVNPVPQTYPFVQNMDFVHFDHQENASMMNPLDVSGPPRVSKEQHRLQFEMEQMKRKYEEEMERYKMEVEMMREQMERQKSMVSQEGYPFELPGYPIDHLQTALSTPSDVGMTTTIEYPDYDPYAHYQPEVSSHVEEEEVSEYQESGYYGSDFCDIQSDMVWTINGQTLIECTPDHELTMTDEGAGALTDYGFEYVAVKQSPSFDMPEQLFDMTYPPPGVYYECIFDDTVYYVPQFLSYDDRPQDFYGSEMEARLPNNSFLKEVVSAPLPRFWSRARDKKSGRNYFFNKRSGKVQWALPDGSGLVEQRVSKEAEITRKATLESIVASADSTATPPLPMPPSSPSNSQASPPGIFAIVNGHEKNRTTDDPDQSSSKKKKARAGVYDIRTKQGLIKFKEEISEFVKKVLYPYRRKDCKVGRISSDEDFKVLARKLTNEVYQKEINSGKTELFVSEIVKSKAKNYIKKYMATKGNLHKVPHSPSSHHSNSILGNSEDHSMEAEEEHLTVEEDVGSIADDADQD